MRIVLLLQDNQAIAYQYRRRQCQSSVCFANTSEGLTDFADFLHASQSDEFTVVLDFEVEQLQLQHIPRVGRRDQASLLGRQRRSLFGAARFAGSYVVDGIKGTRRTVIHYGMPVDACDNPWLLSVDQSGVRVSSVHWLSMLIGPRVSPGHKDDLVRVVLLRLTPADDRVLVLHGRQPLMVRRIAAMGVDGNSETLANTGGDALADQVVQTIAYLDSVPELKTKDGVVLSPDSIVVIGAFTTAEVDAVQNILGISSDRTRYWDPASEKLVNSRLTDLDNTERHSMQEAVVRTVLQRAGFTGSLVFRGAVHLQRQVRHAMVAAGISLLMGGAVALAASRHIDREIEDLVSFAASIDAKAIDVKKANAHPQWSTEYTIDAIRESVTYLDALNTINQATPFHFVVSLSEQLTQHPEVVLQSVEWNSAIDDRHGRPGANNNGTEHFNAVVTGSIGVPPNGQSEAMNRFRSFVASIRDSPGQFEPGLEVTVVELPFAAASALSDDRNSGEFTLEIYSSGNLK